MALAPVQIAYLQESQPIIADQSGRPASWFIRSLNTVFKSLVGAINGVIAAQNAADAAAAAAAIADTKAVDAQDSADTAQTTATGAVSDAATAQAQADAAYALAGTKVTKNQTAAPAYTAYPGQTISAIPTQAEVQALDNAVKAASAALASTISKLHSADVFF